MKAFFQYFFGAGTQQEFALFTPAHFAPIIWMILMDTMVLYLPDFMQIVSDQVHL